NDLRPGKYMMTEGTAPSPAIRHHSIRRGAQQPQRLCVIQHQPSATVAHNFMVSSHGCRATTTAANTVTDNDGPAASFPADQARQRLYILMGKAAHLDTIRRRPFHAPPGNRV